MTDKILTLLDRKGMTDTDLRRELGCSWKELRQALAQLKAAGKIAKIAKNQDYWERITSYD